jgi:hypothetical protein
MTPKNWLIAAAAAGTLALGFSAVSAQAAPVSGVAGDRNVSREIGAVERVDTRYYRYGHRRHLRRRP